jgi:hypothetical protein
MSTPVDHDDEDEDVLRAWGLTRGLSDAGADKLAHLVGTEIMHDFLETINNDDAPARTTEVLVDRFLQHVTAVRLCAGSEMADRPVATSPTLEYMLTFAECKTCWECQRPCVAITMCPHCKGEQYCSPACRDTAWDSQHAGVCVAWRMAVPELPARVYAITRGFASLSRLPVDGKYRLEARACIPNGTRFFEPGCVVVNRFDLQGLAELGGAPLGPGLPPGPWVLNQAKPVPKPAPAPAPAPKPGAPGTGAGAGAGTGPGPSVIEGTILPWTMEVPGPGSEPGASPRARSGGAGAKTEAGKPGVWFQWAPGDELPEFTYNRVTALNDAELVHGAKLDVVRCAQAAVSRTGFPVHTAMETQDQVQKMVHACKKWLGFPGRAPTPLERFCKELLEFSDGDGRPVRACTSGSAFIKHVLRREVWNPVSRGAFLANTRGFPLSPDAPDDLVVAPVLGTVWARCDGGNMAHTWSVMPLVWRGHTEPVETVTLTMTVSVDLTPAAAAARAAGAVPDPLLTAFLPPGTLLTRGLPQDVSELVHHKHDPRWRDRRCGCDTDCGCDADCDCTQTRFRAAADATLRRYCNMEALADICHVGVGDMVHLVRARQKEVAENAAAFILGKPLMVPDTNHDLWATWMAHTKAASTRRAPLDLPVVRSRCRDILAFKMNYLAAQRRLGVRPSPAMLEVVAWFDVEYNDRTWATAVKREYAMIKAGDDLTAPTNAASRRKAARAKSHIGAGAGAGAGTGTDEADADMPPLKSLSLFDIAHLYR